MKTSLRTEYYKFIHQKAFPVSLLVLLLLMVYSALTAKLTTTQIIFEFGAVQWIPIILIAMSSDFFAMEYRHHTISLLLYKNPNKWQIYCAKLLIIILYSLILSLVATSFTVLLKWLLAGHRYHLLTQLGQQTLLSSMLANIGGTLIYALFIVTLGFMLIMLLHLNAAVIGIGLALGFLGAGFSVALMTALPSLSHIIRWNPLNMIFVTSQLVNPLYSQASHLSNPQIISGTLIYALLFTLIGYLLFKRRRV
ncbi:ABC transporter permease [Levilactobacillus spicheri]